MTELHLHDFELSRLRVANVFELILAFGELNLL